MRKFKKRRNIKRTLAQSKCLMKRAMNNCSRFIEPKIFFQILVPSNIRCNRKIAARGFSQFNYNYTFPFHSGYSLFSTILYPRFKLLSRRMSEFECIKEWFWLIDMAETIANIRVLDLFPAASSWSLKSPLFTTSF